MICPICNEKMNVNISFREVEGKEPRKLVSLVCPACKHSEYKNNESR